MANGKQHRVRAKRRGNVILILLLCNCLLAAAVLAVLGVRELRDRKESDAFYKIEMFDVQLAADADAADSAQAPAAQAPADTLHGWDALGQSAKNFAAITAEWPDVKGWIRIADSVIDYPVVQGSDNAYYLDHLPDGRRNASGSIMMDVSNAADFSDDVTILHGHHMRSGSMFGDLDLYQQESYWRDHPVIELSTPRGDCTAEIFAACYVDAVTFAYPTSFASQAEFDAFAARCKADTPYDTGIVPQYGDSLLMLSTCAYVFDDARLLVLARLNLPA